MKLSSLVNPFTEMISERWEISNELELEEYADYHSFDRKTLRYQKALKYLLDRGNRERSGEDDNPKT